MLYLNVLDFENISPVPVHLTLTSVVFELASRTLKDAETINLTLTSVVFELRLLNPLFTFPTTFNFNKCCI